jgi:hypothetical protein
MNIRGLINQVTARGAGAGRPARGPGAAPMGGAGAGAGARTGGPAGPGSPAESTGARIGGMVGRMFNRRGRRL